MLRLQKINFTDIEVYDEDYCKRAQDFEVPEDCCWYGVFDELRLVAYFGLQDAPNDGVYVRRGYVLDGNRGSDIWKRSLGLLEAASRERGFKNIVFETWRNPLAYYRKFKAEGWEMTSAAFRKRI